ncbi:transglutaminase-like domain-containing protein [Methanolacinia paynteri]|uniref:transglutaminase-like domain-containing protein n=1 Tax=Methanolacinia paynteri TaxID=230356 RepID=UPI001FE129D8|nr:transglutaminase-like domain-containing protein [Methanolacinia paynteri]
MNGGGMDRFLEEHPYVDFSSPNIRLKAEELFSGANSPVEKAKIAYEFVRDEIPHSFDINTPVITAKASDVLAAGTGICHAKANLLAALLRSAEIPAGFCYQHLTLADDDSHGYCVHCYNAVFPDDHWIFLDARGNKEGVNAQFSLGEPVLAFPCREEYDEYSWDGIYASPQMHIMKMLDSSKTIQDVIDNLQDFLEGEPDIYPGL